MCCNDVLKKNILHGRLINSTRYLQCFVKISAPVRVIRMVCSNCAAGPRSAVRVVQLSGHVIHSMLPIVRMGSASMISNQYGKYMHLGSLSCEEL